MAASVSLDLKQLVTITQTLESILRGSFGPNALQTTVLTSTGKVMATSDGATILSSLQLEHPVARMVRSSVLSHHQYTGDGTKSFILMLAESLKSTLRRGGKECSTSQAQGNENQRLSKFVIEVAQALGFVLSDILPNYVFPQLERYASATDLTKPEALLEITFMILHTSMSGKAPLEVASHFSHLVSSLIFSDGQTDFLNRVLFLIDNFSTITMEITNEMYSLSQVISGVLLQKESGVLLENIIQRPGVRFVLVECSLEGDQDDETDLPPGVMEISGYRALQGALQWKEQSVARVLQHYVKLGVQFLITSWPLTDLVKSLCRSVGISALGAVPKEDLERMAAMAKIQMIHDRQYVLSDENIGTAKDVMYVVCGGRTFLQLVVKPGIVPVALTGTLVICGPTPGLGRQYSNMILNGLKCIRVWLQSFHISLAAEANGKRKRKYDCAGEDHVVSPDVLGENAAVEHLHKRFKGIQLRSDSREFTEPFLPDLLLDSCSLDSTSKSAFLGPSKCHQVALSLPPGGAVEFIIHHLLENVIQDSTDPEVKTACQVVQDAVLSVPLRLHRNSFNSGHEKHSFMQAKLEALSMVSEGMKPCINAQTGAVRVGSSKLGESVASKMMLLCHVIELLQQLLRLDAIVPVKST